MGVVSKMFGYVSLPHHQETSVGLWMMNLLRDSKKTAGQEIMMLVVSYFTKADLGGGWHCPRQLTHQKWQQQGMYFRSNSGQAAHTIPNPPIT